MFIALNQKHFALQRSAMCSSVIPYMPLLRSGKTRDGLGL